MCPDRARPSIELAPLVSMLIRWQPRNTVLFTETLEMREEVLQSAASRSVIALDDAQNKRGTIGIPRLVSLRVESSDSSALSSWSMARSSGARLRTDSNSRNEGDYVTRALFQSHTLTRASLAQPVRNTFNQMKFNRSRR